MKKLTLSLAVLLALSLTFMSCIFEDNVMYELEEEDISSDWLKNVKWEGTKTVTVTGDTPKVGFDSEGSYDVNRKYSESELKNIIKLDGNRIEIPGFSYTFKGMVKSNRSRSKLWIQEIQEFDSSLYTGTITIVTELEKD